MARRGRFRMGNSVEKAQRRQRAEARQKAREGLTEEQKLAALDARFGAGKGATKERMRLYDRIMARGGDRKSAGIPKKEVQASLAPLGAPTKVVESGAAQFRVFPGQKFSLVFDGRVIPVQSISQLRRLADQHDLEVKPFIAEYKATLAAGGAA